MTSEEINEIFGKAKYVRIMMINGEWVVDEVDNLSQSSQWIDITEMIDDEE